MTDARRRENLTTVTVGKDMNYPRNQQGFRGLFFYVWQLPFIFGLLALVNKLFKALT